MNKYPSILINIINVLTKHSKDKLIKSKDDVKSLSLNLLKNREDWFYHHFGLLLCCINIENEYNLSSQIVNDLINSMIIFLENSSLQIQHLNESVYLTSLLLIKLSKHYFHFFPDNKRLSKLKQRFKHTKMEKMWSLLQSLDRFNI